MQHNNGHHRPRELFILFNLSMFTIGAINMVLPPCHLPDLLPPLGQIPWPGPRNRDILVRILL